MPKTNHSKETTEKHKPKRPRFNFTEMGIPMGAKLVLIDKEISTEVCVSSDWKVKTADSNEEMYLCKVIREVLKLHYNPHPTRYWSYEGKSLNAYYNETYGPRGGKSVTEGGEG